MTTSIRPSAAAVTLALALALTGCGNDEPADGADPAAAPESAAAALPPVAVVDPSPAPEPIGAQAAADGTPYEYLGVTVSGGPDQVPVIELAQDFAPVSELAIGDIWLGEGEPVVPGAMVTVQYTGVGQQTRAEFDSSWTRGSAATFGLDQVIAGWRDGIVGMQPGGRRLLVIPGSQAYGPTGNPPVIQPDETLVFVVDLVSAQTP